MSLLGDLEDEFDDPLDGEGGEVRAELQVVAHRTDEDGQPAVETVIFTVTVLLCWRYHDNCTILNDN